MPLLPLPECLPADPPPPLPPLQDFLAEFLHEVLVKLPTFGPIALSHLVVALAKTGGRGGRCMPQSPLLCPLNDILSHIHPCRFIPGAPSPAQRLAATRRVMTAARGAVAAGALSPAITPP